MPERIISARWVVPVEPAGVVLERHAVVVAEGAIVALLPVADAVVRYPGATHVDLPDHALIPGLVNLHTHAAMTLLRGMADDLALMDWLQTRIWPVEGRFVSAEFVRDGTLLACAEMLRGGITCFNDMYFFPEAAAEAAIAARMRAAVGIIAIEFPSAYATDAQDYLSRGLAMRDALAGEPRLSFCLAPHAPFTVSDATLQRIATYAAELDLPVHTHLHETADEVRQGIEQHRVRPLQRLQHHGLPGPAFIAVHAVHLTPDELDLLATHGAHVAHCPSSNLKLASGIAPVADMLARGINVGLGTDGAASNNRLDLFSEMRLAALLGKAAAHDASALPAHAVLRMATLGGAKALGLDARIGSLTPGKRADMVAVDLSRPELSPCYDPVSHLVYAAGREHVRHVWVDGDMLVKDGELVQLDTRDVVARANHWKDRIRSS